MKLSLHAYIHIFIEVDFLCIIYCAPQPWIFTEIKEQRHWDITSGERLNILKDFVHFGLEHWGSDKKGMPCWISMLLCLYHQL